MSSTFSFASISTTKTETSNSLIFEKQQNQSYIKEWSYTVTDVCGVTWTVTGTSQVDLPLIAFVDAVMNWIESNTGADGCISNGGPETYFYD